MLEDGKITCRQIIYLIFLSRIIITFTYLPISDTPPRNQDVWISELLSFPVHMLLVLPVYILSQRFKGCSIIQASEIIFGKIGKIIGAMYTWFFLHMTAIVLRQFGEFLSSVPYPETPIIVFISSITLFAAFALRNGLEVISRVGEIVTPIVIGSIVLVVALVAKDMDLKVLKPVLEGGFIPVLYGGFIVATRTTEILFISMLLPYLNRRKLAKRVILVSFILLTILAPIITISVLATFGVQQTLNRTFPFFSTIRIISVANFLERIDALHLGIWVLGVFVKVAIYYYLTVLGAAQVLNLKDYRSIIIPIGTIIISLSILIADSQLQLREFISYKYSLWYALFFILALPLFMLIVSALRGKGMDLK